MSEQTQRAPLRKVGVAWKPKAGSRAILSGSITIAGLRQKFFVVANESKTSDRSPDYKLLASDEPEDDPYAAGRQS